MMLTITVASKFYCDKAKKCINITLLSMNINQAVLTLKLKALVRIVANNFAIIEIIQIPDPFYDTSVLTNFSQFLTI